MMIIIPSARVMVPTLALVMACGAGLVFAITQPRREPPVEARAATGTVTAAATVPSGSSAAQDLAAAGLAQAKAEAAAAMDALAPSPPDVGGTPAFDVARIGRAGDAVVAGRAAPGATVELLLDGKVYDHAIADKSGQFAMLPPRLPAGDYSLTLRSRQQDGKEAMSAKSVTVALHPSPNPGPSNPSQAYQLASTPQIATARESTASPEQPADPTTVTSSSGRGSSFVRAVRKGTTAVVAGGDSLWSISRLNFGRGERYPVIYNANRNQIRDPNRIYPGQIIIIPSKAQ
jgi:nucleoid-associated protein YgaU